MTQNPDSPTLHLMCGKIASGKSTLSAELGKQDRAIVIAEDEWLAALYGDALASLADYARAMTKLRGVIGPHVLALLKAGQSVVLDFQANTIEARAWMRDILDEACVAHKLHFLDIPDEVCLARLRARNAQGDHPFAPTEEQFRRVSSHFVPPQPEERFNVVRYTHDS